MMVKAADRVGLPLEKARVAVVGASGSVGSGIAQMCAPRVTELILIDKRELNPVVKKIKQVSDVLISTDSLASAAGRADILLVATSAANVLFDPKDFRPGAIVLDDSQPKNVDSSLLEVRDDILVLEAGVVEPPGRHKIEYRRAFGPKLRKFHWKLGNLLMSGSREVPCCLAEAMLWKELEEEREEYSLGRADPSLATSLKSKADLLGYRAGQLQSFGRKVTKKRLTKVRAIYNSREGEANGFG